MNPRFNGDVKPTVVNGVVTGLQFLSDEVNDISPVRMLEGLRELNCRGSSPGRGKLTDLAPLAGLRLTALYFLNTRVSDLTPLKRMKLTVLDLNNTEVADLTPLRGMPLDVLNLYGARKVSDLRPLEDMPVMYLNLCYLPVSDLSVLASLKRLRHLVQTSVLVADLTPLRGLRLDILGIEGTRVTDLTPLKGKHIIELFFDYRPDHENILRSLPWLKTINGKPAAKFWKEVSGK